MPSYCYKSTSFDLHVLGTPPAFILSQDQTLRQNLHSCECKVHGFYWIDRVVLLPITIQLLRCCFRGGSSLSTASLPVKSANRRKHRCSLRIGWSDCKASRLVSLTRDLF